MGERVWDAHLARVLGDGTPPFADVDTTGSDFEHLAASVFGPLLEARREER